jgi:hypothetical protein
MLVDATGTVEHTDTQRGYSDPEHAQSAFSDQEMVSIE